MNNLDYLLASLGEECGEVQQIVGKSLRFGIRDFSPKDLERTINFDLLTQEIHDVVALYEMICDEIDETYYMQDSLLETKKHKVTKWMQYAKKVGQLD